MTVRGARLALTLAFFAASCGHEKTDAPARAPEPRIHVDTITVDERAVPRTIELTGVLDADQRTDLAANANGRVLRTYVELGQHVKEGDPVAKLDSRTASIGATEAKANAESAAQQLETARAECERYEKLHAKGAVTDEEYDRTMSKCGTEAANTEAARARVASALQSVTDANVRAPFAGVIASRFVSAGDYVKPDSKVVTLLVDDPLRVKLTVPEPFIGFVKEGLIVSFVAIARPGRTFSATVKYVGREVRATTRDLVVEALAPNADGALFVGMFVTANLTIGTVSLPVIPKTALVPLEDSESVFAVVGDRLQRRVIQVGPREGDWVAAQGGVSKGDRIVDKPSPTMNDGALVQ